MIEDEYGNKVYIRGNDLYLQLENSYPRKLGTLNRVTRTLNAHRKYGPHLYRMSNSFGFNLKLLETAESFDTIHLTTDRDEIFKIPRAFILDNGHYLHFQQKGFEKQIFIKLEQLKQYKYINI